LRKGNYLFFIDFIISKIKEKNEIVDLKKKPKESILVKKFIPENKFDSNSILNLKDG
jgi:hypothetical protein